MYHITEKLWFPDPEVATQDGLLGIGGDLSVARLLLAYNSGIFPWFEIDQPILWWSPDPRMILFPNNFKVSKSFQKVISGNKFSVTFNQNFEQVISYCANIPRKRQAGTWITPEMQTAYLNLHRAGYAFSIEVWSHNKLVGGLYGIDLEEKKIFCGESMFSLVSNASKVAFYYLSEYAKSRNYKFIDCQVYNSHLESLGATEIPRAAFLAHIYA